MGPTSAREGRAIKRKRKFYSISLGLATPAPKKFCAFSRESRTQLPALSSFSGGSMIVIRPNSDRPPAFECFFSSSHRRETVPFLPPKGPHIPRSWQLSLKTVLLMFSFVSGLASNCRGFSMISLASSGVACAAICANNLSLMGFFGVSLFIFAARAGVSQLLL